MARPPALNPGRAHARARSTRALAAAPGEVGTWEGPHRWKRCRGESPGRVRLASSPPGKGWYIGKSHGLENRHGGKPPLPVRLGLLPLHGEVGTWARPLGCYPRRERKLPCEFDSRSLRYAPKVEESRHRPHTTDEERSSRSRGTKHGWVAQPGQSARLISVRPAVQLRLHPRRHHARIAQPEERQRDTLDVAGSNPASRTTHETRTETQTLRLRPR